MPDGSSLITGSFFREAIFGYGEVNETTVTAANNDDIFVARYNANGTLAWVKTAGGYHDEWGKHISSFPDESFVVCGYMWGSVTFGPGEANETILEDQAVGSDMFIARYNQDGTLAWARRLGEEEEQENYAAIDCGGVTARPDGTCIVVGSFFGQAIFGKDEVSETILVSEGDNDVFIAKYNEDGSLAWAQRDGGIKNVGAYGISSLDDGSFLVTGNFKDSAKFGFDQSDEVTLTSEGLWDIFVARYNSGGTLSWATSAGGTETAIIHDIAAMPHGSFLLSGSFEGSITLGRSEQNETILISDGRWDVFLARYNEDGTLSWARKEGGPDYEVSSGVSVLPDGSCVVVGGFHGTTTFGPSEANETTLSSVGCTDVFIAKYDNTGALEWVTKVSGPVECEEFVTRGERAGGVAGLTDGSFLVTGIFDESATFFHGETYERTIISEGYLDIFLMKIGP